MEKSLPIQFLISLFFGSLSFAQEIKIDRKNPQVDGVILMIGAPEDLRDDFINDELLFENAMMKWQGLHPESKRFKRLKHSSVMNHGVRGFKRNDLPFTEDNLTKTFQFFKEEFKKNLEKNDTLWIEIFAHGIPWGFQVESRPFGQLAPYESLFFEIVKFFPDKNIIIHSNSCFSGSIVLAAQHSRNLKNFTGTLTIITDSHPELPVSGIPVEKSLFTVKRATFPSFYFFSALAGEFPDGEVIDLTPFDGASKLEKAFQFMKTIPGVGFLADEFPVRGSFSLVPTLRIPGQQRVHHPQFFTLGNDDFEFSPVKRPQEEYFREDQAWVSEIFQNEETPTISISWASRAFKIIYREDAIYMNNYEGNSQLNEMDKIRVRLKSLTRSRSKWLLLREKNFSQNF